VSKKPEKARVSIVVCNNVMHLLKKKKAKHKINNVKMNLTGKKRFL